ncbi:MAG: GCN5-related N-acetyltransferase [Klenkia sp.]|nr:GCN5-related N-acetyltransferase [Klenkia sp.]
MSRPLLLDAGRELRTVVVHPDDPRATPLFAGLGGEHDRRYGDLFGGSGHELGRYPAEVFTAPHGAFLVLVEDGVTVAGGGFMPHADPGTAEVERVWTATGHRRRGLARRVLTELEAVAHDRGVTRLYLTTGPRQPEAKALYLAAGWTPLSDPAVPRPTDLETLRALPVADRVYAFEKHLGDPR